jgi:hypothetical protein
VYQVPAGKGRRYLRQGPLSWVLGGYQITAIEEYQPGSLIKWGNTMYYTGCKLSDLCNGPQTIGQWFDTTKFVTVGTLQANTGQATVMPNYVSEYGSCRAMSLST